MLKLGEFRDFARVIQREKTTLGLFTCLQEPTEKSSRRRRQLAFTPRRLAKRKFPFFKFKPSDNCWPVKASKFQKMPLPLA